MINQLNWFFLQKTVLQTHAKNGQFVVTCVLKYCLIKPYIGR